MLKMRYSYLFLVIFFLISNLFSKDISLKYKNNLKDVLGVKNTDKKKVVNSISNEDFPVTSTFYQLSEGMDIEASYSYQEGNVEIIDLSEDFLINSGYEIGEDSIFPKNNLIVSEPQIFRGLVVRQITFIPFSYNIQTKELVVLNDIQITVEQVPGDLDVDYREMKLSRSFERLYESLIVNYERSTREEDYQTPSILYICGGSSMTHPYVENLLHWRHKTGYIVNAVSTSEIGGSGTASVKGYIQEAYDNWENPPEIVGLIGDTGGSYSIGYYTEGWSGYNGAGDFPYCQLDGSDLLPEVFIGRISVNSSSDLSNVINKTLVYEKATNISQTGTNWYEKGSIVGDPSSSGNSTMITGEYIENILDVYGFEDINTNFGNGNYDNWLENELEDGTLYMSYRGYYGASGFGSSEINGANNGYQTPFASFITCGTGDFNYTALSEDLLRAGSVANPKGAVAAVGTATTGTHTLFNNIMSMGIFDGIFPKDLRTAGAAVANGRLSLYWTYPSDPSNKVSIFSHWLNLMGDPALHLWTDTPTEINAEFNNSISWGTNFIDVTITDENNGAVEDALVTLLKGDDELFISVLTNSEGEARILWDYESVGTGEVYLTVTKKDCIPIEESFQIIQPNINVNLSLENIEIIDQEDGVVVGNSDGYLNPGEIVYLSLPLLNYGNAVPDNLIGSLTSNSDLVNIIYGVSSYESISSGSLGYNTSNYIIEVAPDALDSSDLGLRLSISSSNQESWESIIPVDLQGGFIIVDHIDYLSDTSLNPGESGEINVYLKNEGSIQLDNVTIELSTEPGSLINVEQGFAELGDISSGTAVESSPLSLFINGNTINGSHLPINARILSDNGYNQDIVFNIQAGEVSMSDPLGPDEYGYYIYDSQDLGYSLAPVYDWIEIDNDLGGDGIDLNLSDNGDGNNINNSLAIIDLPFDFTFYGITYDKITVNTNGWIAFGESNLESFRNYPIPGAGGPSPMLAAFWDDLKTTGSAEIYKYIGENFVIIEWSDMRTYNNNSTETFQVILYDQSAGLTPTGDNEIKIQYKDFNNTSNGNLSGWGNTHGGYATIGIENHLSTIGLQYTFNNVYPTAAMPLSDNKAIFITTRNPIETLMGDANQDGEVNVIDVVIIVNHILVLELLSPIGVYISDMDGDGVITILDVIQVIQSILNS